MYVVLGQAAAAAEVRRLELSLQEERERLRRQAEAETLPGGEAAWRTDAVGEAALSANMRSAASIALSVINPGWL